MADADVVARLGAKLDALDLTDDERALLTDLLAPDDEAEVVGFNSSFAFLLSEVHRSGAPRASGPGRPMFRA